MIKSIEITDFRSISNLKWSYNKDKPINLLFGKNGIGKSSVLSAIRFALTGNANREDVADKAESATVYVELDDGSSFSRTIYALDKPAKIKVNGKLSSLKVLNEKLEHHFNIPVADMKFVSAKELGAASSSDFSAFIGKVLPDDLSADTVLSYAECLSTEQKEILKTFLPDHCGISDFDNICEKIATNRKANKQLLAIYKGKMTFSGCKPQSSCEEIDKEIASLLIQKDKEEAIRKATTNYEDALAKKETWGKEVTKLTAEIATITATKPSEKVYEIALKEKNDALADIATLSGTIKTLENNVAMFEKILSNLSSSKCPLSDLVVCTTDKTGAKDEIQKTVDETKANIANCYSKKEALSQKTVDCDKRLEEYAEQLNKYNEKQQLIIKLDALKNNVPIVPEKPEAVPDTSAINNRIKVLQAEKNNAVLYNEAQAAAEQVSRLEKLVSDLDVVYKNMTAKGEIRTNIMSFYIDFFDNEINDIAQHINPDYRFNFSIENGITPYFATKKDAFARKYEFLSQGEKVICDLLLLLFCSKFGSSGIVFVDNLNDLDEDNTKAVASLLTSLSTKEYPIIFVAAVDTPEIKKVFDVPSAVTIF